MRSRHSLIIAQRNQIWTARWFWPLILVGGSLLPTVASAQLGPATGAGVRSMEHAAEQGVAQDALARAHAGGNRGGCRPLPAGWAAFDVTVDFPKAYAGYPAWVNFAELLPGNADVKAYVAGANPPGVLMRPALRAGAMAVRSHLCAPAGQRYWLVVDSGMAKVAIGRISLGAAPGPYTFTMTAPPLGQQPRSFATSSSRPAPVGMPSTGTDAPPQTTRTQPVPTGAYAPPTTGPGFVPPGSTSSSPPGDRN